MSLVHLHCHSQGSLFDGLATPDEMVARAVKLGQEAIALTDHGVMAGVPEFYRCARHAGIQPLIGIEAYVVPDALAVGFGAKGNLRDRSNYHLTLLAVSEQGYKDLVRLSTASHTEEYYYYRPRMDYAMLRDVGTDDLVCLSGCVMGELASTFLDLLEPIVATEILSPEQERIFTRRGYSLRRGFAWPKWSRELDAKVRADERFEVALEAARSVLRNYRSMFPEGHYFYEIMLHGYTPEEWCHRYLFREAKRYGLPHVVTNDAHYAPPSHKETHDLLMASQFRSTFCGSPDGKLLDLCSERELGRRLGGVLTPEEYAEGVANTSRIAAMADGFRLAPLENKTYRIPQYRDDKGDAVSNAGAILRKWRKPRLDALCELYPEQADEYRERDRYELSVIKKFGFYHYFLIVADYIRWAKKSGIRVGAGRGSAAGSLVAFTLGITEIDPIQHGLLFERFLSPHRLTMPDFDTDFQSRHFDRVLEYIGERYGSENVARVCAYDKLRPKSLVQKIFAAIAAMPAKDIARLTADMDDDLTRRDAEYLEEWWDTVAPDKVREVDEESPFDLKTHAKRLFQLPVSVSAHAAAVVIAGESDDGIRSMDYVPKQFVPSSRRIVTQFDMDNIEGLGLVKFDCLSIATLDTIADTIERIGFDPFVREVEERGALYYDDEATYQMITAGQTDGMFQLSGGTAKQVINMMGGCRDFSDLVAVMALGRPSAIQYAPLYRENRRLYESGSKPELIHPDLHDLITNGIFLFQEDVMRVLWHVGMSPDEVDSVMHAVKKKDIDEFRSVEDSFIGKSILIGWTSEQAAAVWELIVAYAGYGFNKAHSVSYAHLAYQTGFLKANYPAAFIAAKMRQFSANADAKKKRQSLPALVRDAKRLGVTILPPDVNKSGVTYEAVDDSTIRCGLSDINGIGVQAAKRVIASRPYTVDDFVAESESIGPRGGVRKHPAKLGNAGVNSGVVMKLLFAGAIPDIEIEDYWDAEQELLYCNISEHPDKETLEHIREAVFDKANFPRINPAELHEYEAEGTRVGGVVLRVHEHKYVPKGKKETARMGFVDLELDGHEFSLVIFAESWVEVRSRVKQGKLLLARANTKYEERRGLSHVATHIEAW